MTIVVQIVLILAVAYGALTLVRGGANAKHQAIRRLAAVAFFVFAAISFMVTQYTTAQHRRAEEVKLTRIARHIAISETEKPWEPDAAHGERRSVRAFRRTSPLGRPVEASSSGYSSGHNAAGPGSAQQENTGL